MNHQESEKSYKLRIHLIPDDGVAPGLPKSRRFHEHMNFDHLFHEICAQFQIPQERHSLYCLSIAHSNVVVTNYEVLSKQPLLSEIIDVPVDVFKPMDLHLNRV